MTACLLSLGVSTL